MILLRGIKFQKILIQEDIDILNIEVDALVKAKELTIGQVEIVSRVLFGTDPDKVSTAELKRDVLVYARNQPQNFLEVLSDPELTHTSKVKTFFKKGLLSFRNNQKDVYFNTPSNKKRMLVVPFGEDPYYVVASYLKSERGIESLKMLESNLED